MANVTAERCRRGADRSGRAMAAKDRRSDGYLCNLVLPGAAKSGTSSLHALLDRHPAITMSNPKEPHHFTHADRFGAGSRAHNALFEQTGSGIRVFGEASTTYLVSDAARRRIAEALVAPKIIVLLRHPVARAGSH